MALPPTVVGWYLLTQLGGPGPIRSAEVSLFGHPLTFTFTGIVVAQIVESFPYCLRFSRAAISGVDRASSRPLALWGCLNGGSRCS